MRKPPAFLKKKRCCFGSGAVLFTASITELLWTAAWPACFCVKVTKCLRCIPHVSGSPALLSLPRSPDCWSAHCTPAHQLCSISSLVLHHSSPGCYFSRCLMKVLHHHELCAFDSCVDSDSRTNLLPISCACQPNQTWSHPLPSSPLSTSSPPTSFPQPSPAVILLHLHPPPLPDCKQ